MTQLRQVQFRPRRRHAAWSARLAWLLFGVATGAPAQTLSLTPRLGVFSHLMVRGMLLSDGHHPVGMAGLDLYSTDGWSLGGSLMRMKAGDGRLATELSWRAGYEQALDDTWAWSLQARHDSSPDNDVLQVWCYNQIGANLSMSDLWSVGWSWRPRHGPGCDNQAASPIQALDLNGRWPLVQGIGLDLGVGRLYDGGAGSYNYGQWGLYASRESWSLAVTRVQTEGVYRRLYGQLGRPRWVLSWVWLGL